MAHVPRYQFGNVAHMQRYQFGNVACICATLPLVFN
jgi:hypothetical protein